MSFFSTDAVAKEQVPGVVGATSAAAPTPTVTPARAGMRIRRRHRRKPQGDTFPFSQDMIQLLRDYFQFKVTRYDE